MSDENGKKVDPHSKASNAFDELIERQVGIRRMAIAKHLRGMDPSAPETLQFGIKAMLESKFEPKELSLVLGPSRTTIGRWAMGHTIPRSPPYRKWCVEAIIELLDKANDLANTSDTPPQNTKASDDLHTNKAHDDSSDDSEHVASRPEQRKGRAAHRHATAG
jgi:hypothetical protein